MPTLESNMPPELVDYTVAPDEPIQVVGTGGQAVFVLAEDPDDDEIVFLWSLSRDGFISDATPINFPSGQGSQVHLDRDPELDGQELRCSIDDGQSELVVLRWPVEVP